MFSLTSKLLPRVGDHIEVPTSCRFARRLRDPIAKALRAKNTVTVSVAFIFSIGGLHFDFESLVFIGGYSEGEVRDSTSRRCALEPGFC